MYIVGATTSAEGTSNLKPLGPTGALHLELVPPVAGSSEAHASVSINSLGLIDNLQVAATGLEPGGQYRLVLTGGPQPQDLVSFKAGIGGVAIVQTFGPLKRHMSKPEGVKTWKLEVRDGKPGSENIILRQARAKAITQ